VNYRVTAALDPGKHQLTARATVDFVANTTSAILEIELNTSLKLSSVSGADRKPLTFEREGDSERVRITLPTVLAPGEKTALTFDYAGAFVGDVTGSGAPQLGYIGVEGSYLLLPARWFPLTGYPGNRYTAVFEIAVPEPLNVVGTGKSVAPTKVTSAAAAGAAAPAASAATPASRARAATTPPPAPLPPLAPPGSLLFTFNADEPSSAGTFVVGALELVPASSEGLNVAVYVPPAAKDLAKAHGEAVARAVPIFSEAFGGLQQPALTLVHLPGLTGAPQGYSAPGLILLNARQWNARVNDRLLAQLVARQWWENEVLPATPSDAWLAEGLARYSEALYAQAEGEEGFNRALDEFAIGALTYEDAAPIAEAARLEPFTAEYRSVVLNKGAMVFHMLRGQMGDAAFMSLLREYHEKFRGKAATLDDFEKLAKEKAAGMTQCDGKPFNLGPFLSQWLHSTGVPEFKLEYIVVRTRQGFRIVGKVKQNLETFRMTVGVRVLTDGNPETKTIEIAGANSDFVIETFGRPKPGGIQLDPQNHLLKASPQLYVRAAIARGEGFAEQGKYYEAIQEYQRALELQPNSSLAHFRMAEAFFYQKNRQAAANAFRDAINGDLTPKWIEVWSHIYLGKIFDLSGARERAINEYSKARDTNDDTGGAQAEIEKYLKEPYTEPDRP
jgi:tetratricopeptide (TPR) repeat protein